MLLFLSVVFAQQAVAQKESHGDYSSMKIAECNGCHKGEGVALNHDTDWVRGHRISAGKGSPNCTQCHDQAWCLDCHQGGGTDPKQSTQNFKRDFVPKSHRSDFLELHPLKALDNPQSCYRCHDQKYCSSCHAKFKSSDLQFVSHRRQFSDIKLSSIGPKHETFSVTQCQNCHAGSILPVHQWSAEHGREARRNLQSCQSCHSDGETCLKCHSSRSGLKINPHPRNWNAVKNNLKDKSKGRTCSKCHDNY
jgi:hypothetical protein